MLMQFPVLNALLLIAIHAVAPKHDMVCEENSEYHGKTCGDAPPHAVHGYDNAPNSSRYLAALILRRSLLFLPKIYHRRNGC